MSNKLRSYILRKPEHTHQMFTVHTFYPQLITIKLSYFNVNPGQDFLYGKDVFGQDIWFT